MSDLRLSHSQELWIQTREKFTNINYLYQPNSAMLWLLTRLHVLYVSSLNEACESILSFSDFANIIKANSDIGP
jgi:hypothetical protein